MPKLESKKKKAHFTLAFLPFDLQVKVQAGTSILDAIQKASLPLKTTCGGKGTCGDCIVHVKKGSFKPKPSAALKEELTKRGYALACQTQVHDNLTVELPQYQQFSLKVITDSRFFEENRASLSGVYEIASRFKKIELKLPSPTLDNNYSDLTRLQRELRKILETKNIDCEYSVLNTLAHTVREKQGHVTVITLKKGKYWIVVDIKPHTKNDKIFGIACDIGTTTVALHLVDLEDGKIIATASDYNQQIKCGEDIISRINYSQKPGRLQELHSLITKTVNSLIQKACDCVNVSPLDIYYASFSGNTTMTHLFLNLEPRYIREEPYVPTFNQVPTILSRELGLRMNHEGMVHCAPAVGSYVGGDITAGLLCTPILKSSEKTSLFIDVGTNGELVVGNRDWLMTCACSAGPAFEGMGIRCGMPAAEGAIEKVRINEKGAVEYSVIGKGKPKGVCGSGLVDLLAELFIHGYLDRNGKFKSEPKAPRIIETERGRGFLIEEGKKCHWGHNLILAENDIATLIRTKGAVFSACSLLLKNVGISFDEVDAFYIAGGFGQHLNIENAIRIGLLPDIERERYHYLGNSSLLGAYLILISEKNREIVNKIAEKMTYIELNTEPRYMTEYTGALFLPHTDMRLFPTVKKIFE